jgi:hypothetical protein
VKLANAGKVGERKVPQPRRDTIEVDEASTKLPEGEEAETLYLTRARERDLQSLVNVDQWFRKFIDVHLL